jgi:hypothetical protein
MAPCERSQGAISRCLYFLTGLLSFTILNEDRLDQPEAGLHEKLPSYVQALLDLHILSQLLSLGLYNTPSNTHFSILKGTRFYSVVQYLVES